MPKKQNKKNNISAVLLAANLLALIVVVGMVLSIKHENKVLKKIALYSDWNSYNACIYGVYILQEGEDSCLISYLDDDKDFVEELRSFGEENGLELELVGGEADEPLEAPQQSPNEI